MSMKYGVVTKAVRNVLTMKPYLYICLEEGVVNYSKLADKIRNEVIELVGSDIDNSAIKMALIRYSHEIKGSRDIMQPIKVLSKSSLQLINDVVLFTLEIGIFKDIFGLVQYVFEKRGFIQITQGRNTISLVMEKRFYDDIRGKLKDRIIYKLDNQSAILIVSPEEIISTPGIIYLITGILYSNGINITQVISSYLDTIIIVSRQDGSSAFHLLDALIRWYKNRLI